MKPIYQTRYHIYNNGNCLAACLASILEKNIDEFDDISYADYPYWELVRRKLKIYSIKPKFYNSILRPESTGICIAFFVYAESINSHAVVADYSGLEYSVVHDPGGQPVEIYSQKPYWFQASLFLLADIGG